METSVIPLGTASAMPTRNRHLPATALERKGRILLFDCGEGTQLQFLRGELNRSRVDAIFLSHLHGDHVYGIFGLLSTMGQLGRREPVSVIAPHRFAESLPQVPGFKNEWLPFDVRFVGLSDKMNMAEVFVTDELVVSASELDHREISFGFRLEERPRPGRLDPEKARKLGADPVKHFRKLKTGQTVELEDGTVIKSNNVVGPERPGTAVAYISDTRPCDASIELANQSDLLYHEATFGDELGERAVETGHSTAREAGRIARESSTRRLLLSHFSARYADPAQLVTEARQEFENTEAAQELNRYVLDPREKWGQG